MDKMELFFERQAISDLLIRYGRALDDRDWEKLETCFLPDAVAIYGEEFPPCEGFKAILETVRFALEKLDGSQHIITNHEMKIDGDTAHTHCYLHAQHKREGTPGGDYLTIGGSYIDEIVKTPDGWKIKKRHLKVTWQEGNPAVVYE